MERAAAGLRLLILTVTLVASGAFAAAARQVPAYRAPDHPSDHYLLLLRKGPKWSAMTSAETAELQRAHLLHLSMLAADKRVLITGSIVDDGDVRGAAILDSATLADAQALEVDDPAVKAGRLSAEVHALTVSGNWFAFAAMTGDQPVRQYVLVLLRDPPGINRPDNVISTPTHLEALWRSRESGGLLLAGVIGGDGPLRGLRVYVGDDLAAATDVARQEAAIPPAFGVEIHPWLAPDGILSIVK